MPALMLGPLNLAQWVVLAVAVQRLVELRYSKANCRRLAAAGALEAGQKHHPLFVLLHGSWLAAIFVQVSLEGSLSPTFLAIYLLLQVFRVWIFATLGRRWTTRVLVLPGERPRTGGPFRLCRHPNYLLVALEIAVLPMVFGLWETAVIYSFLSALLTRQRIQVEDALWRAVAAPPEPPSPHKTPR
jgi:methyltransferase|tara:strand:+ start:6088 stop:6645 length:558 start_codon:yes stop_codon:yes gene_type:complete